MKSNELIGRIILVSLALVSAYLWLSYLNNYGYIDIALTYRSKRFVVWIIASLAIGFIPAYFITKKQKRQTALALMTGALVFGMIAWVIGLNINAVINDANGVVCRGFFGATVPCTDISRLQTMAVLMYPPITVPVLLTTMLFIRELVKPRKVDSKKPKPRG